MESRKKSAQSHKHGRIKMKIYVALSGGCEAEILGIFSNYEDAARYCVQQEGDALSAEINVGAWNVDEKKIKPEIRALDMPFYVRLSVDGASASAVYAGCVAGKKLPDYAESHSVGHEPFCQCICVARNECEAMEVARRMQREFVAGGYRATNEEIAKQRHEFLTAHRNLKRSTH